MEDFCKTQSVVQQGSLKEKMVLFLAKTTSNDCFFLTYRGGSMPLAKGRAGQERRLGGSGKVIKSFSHIFHCIHRITSDKGHIGLSYLE